MVQTLSLVGAAFAVGGSYFALDSLRDVLIAKSINTPVATRLAMASAAVIGGLFLFGRSEGSAAGQRAKETVKEDIIAKIEAASEQFAAEPDDPNYMVKSDIHKIAESGIRMTVLIDEYPDADLPIWLKSKLSVTASEADGVADNMGYALADPEAFDAEGRGSRRDLGRFSRPRKPSAGYYRRKGRRAALSSLFSADSNGAVDLTVEAICNNEYCDFCSVARHDDSNDYGLKYWFLSQMTDVACIGEGYPGEIEKTWRGLLDLEPCSNRTLPAIPCSDLSCATCKIDRLETMDEIADLLVDTAQEIADQKSRQEILAAWRRAMGYTDGCRHASKTSKKSAESGDTGKWFILPMQELLWEEADSNYWDAGTPCSMDPDDFMDEDAAKIYDLDEVYFNAFWPQVYDPSSPVINLDTGEAFLLNRLEEHYDTPLIAILIKVKDQGAIDELIKEGNRAFDQPPTLELDYNDPLYDTNTSMDIVIINGQRHAILWHTNPDYERVKNDIFARAGKTSKKSAESDDWPADVELAIGTHEELEHTDNAGEARRIAQDHLDENPNYYEILASAGLVGRNLPPNRVAQTIRQVVALNTQERGRPAGNAWIWTPLFHPRTSEDAMAQVINIVAAIPDDGGMFHHSQFPSQEWAYLDDDSGMLHLITVSTHSGWKHLMVNIVQGTAKQSTIPMGFMRMIGRERRSRSAFTDKNAESDDDDGKPVPDKEPRKGAPDLWFSESSNPYCNLYEKTQRWNDGRYRCGDRKGHAGRCSAWSRSGSGKQSFDGYPPCEHIKAGQRDCGCILGDGVDDSIGARLANHPLFKKKSAESSVDGHYTCAFCGDGFMGSPPEYATGGMEGEDFCSSSCMEDYYGHPSYEWCPNPICGHRHFDIPHQKPNAGEDWGCKSCHAIQSRKKSAEYDQPIPAAGTPFTCDCGAECTVDATTEIAFGPGSYDLRCGRNDDCRGDEKVLGAESSDSDILILRDNLNTGYIGYLWQFKNSYGTDDPDEIRRMVKAKDDLERVPRWNRMSIGPKTVAKVDRRKTPLPVDFNRDSQFKDAEVFEAFSLSDRPVSVKFGPGTSGNAKMKATFTDASGDTKTTQFGYRGMSDYTKHKDADRRSAYLARHGSKAQGENWKDPTTAGALSRYVLWEKTSLPAAKSAFKKRFNLRAEGDDADTYVGYQVSPFITEWDRLATWTYEPDYSITEESL